MLKTVATKIAHNSTIPALAGNSDLRPLQDLITAEKAVLVSLQRLSIDFTKASEALRTWGLGEGDDLGDALNASANILLHFSSAISQYASHGHRLRDQLKAIRTREEALDDLKRRRKTVMSQADSAEKKLSKMSPEHKNLSMQQETLNRFRSEIRSLDADILAEEASLGDFKRTQVKTVMGLKFGGLLECSEKSTIVGEYGKLVVAEIVEEVTPPGLPRSLYGGHSRTEELVAEVHRRVSGVVLSTMVPAPAKEPQGDYFAQDQVTFQPRFDNSPWAKNDSPTNTKYLATPQGLENGRFLDPNPPSLSFDPPPGVPHRSSSYELRDGFRKNTVDEFGTSAWNSTTAGESRFNTSPSKIGSTSDGDMHSDRVYGPSFSSTITEALSSIGNPQGTTIVRISVDSAAPPSYVGLEDLPLDSPRHFDSDYQRSDSRFSRHSHALSEEPAQLTYLGGAGEQSVNDTSHQGLPRIEASVTGPYESHGSDQNLETREQDLSQRVSQSHSVLDIGSGRDVPMQNTFDTRYQSQPIRSEEEERALDVAAAREVSREMEGMGYNRPRRNSLPQSVHSTATDELKSSPSAVGDDSRGQLTLTQEPPPLLPPVLPFAKQGLSPRPSYERLQQSPLPSTPNQTYHTPLIQARQNLPPTYEHSPPLPSPMTPRFSHSHVPPSPQISAKPSLAPLSISSRGSPEQIFSAVAPAMSKVPTSSSLPPGGRTISAAAFKRAVPRNGSDAAMSERRLATMGSSSQLQSPAALSSPMERANSDSRPLPMPPQHDRDGDFSSGDNAGKAQDYYSSGRFVTNLEDEWK